MKNHSRRHALPVFLLLFVLSAGPAYELRAQPPAVMNAAETEAALGKLRVLGSVLYVAAHPDDENTALLAYLSTGRAARTAYLSVTRGDGGQNLLGTEKGELLGLVRTQELLAARRVDGAEQFFTRAVDFGFTKSPEEALRVWGREEALSDVVWVIRRFRPDVVITRFPTTGEGGHGQHTASAVLAREAFEAAGDPARFPEQLRHVRPWRPKRLLWNVFRRGAEEAPRAGAPPAISVDLGEYNALLGKSYTEIAAASRSMHKSQGFGSAERRGTAPNTLAHLAGEPAARDIFDGVDTTWARVAGGAQVGRTLEEAARQFSPAKPRAILPLLLRAHRELAALPADEPWVSHKRRELLDVIRACAGLWVEAIAAEPQVTPGGGLKVTATLVNRSDFPLRLLSVGRAGDGPPAAAAGAELRPNQPLQTEITVRVPAGAEPTQPYWLRAPAAAGLFSVRDQALVGEPENGPALPVRLEVAAGAEGERLVFEIPALFRWTDRVRGELYRPVEIVPEVSVELDEAVLVFPDLGSRRVRVRVRANTAAGASGTLRLRAPAGWRATPESAPVALEGRGDEAAATFDVAPSPGAPGGTLSAEVEAGGRHFTRGMREIDYPHIPRQTVFPAAEARLVPVDLRKRGAEIGYVMGSGDEIPEALRQVGYRVTLLSDADLEAADLKKFDAVVTGVRAYNTRAALRRRQGRLLEYVEAGGTLVVQYNTADASLAGVALGPYPFRLSQERVTVEEAPVRLLAPDDPLLARPNKITAADFEGWVQERGLNFPAEWDPRYRTIFESHDPGEGEKRGGTLVARHGRGTYVYTSYSWFRQLPAGVPGAYRLFVNLISGGGE